MKNLLRRPFSIILLVSCGVIFVASAKTERDKERLHCSQKELALQNCILRGFNYKVQFDKDKILVNDGVWRSMDKIPMAGPDANWESIQLVQVNKRIFIEFLVWDPPKGEVNLQTLHWNLIELKGVDGKAHLNEVVQKRRTTQNKSGQNTFVYDKKDTFGLKPVGKSKVIWFLNKKTTEI